MKRILSLLFFLYLVNDSQAQFSRYLVKLKNKGGGNPYSFSVPTAYLSIRAIDRRTRYNIPLDSTDLPVTPAYVTQIDNVPNVTILNVSKWLNAISIQTTDANAITTISGFPFVQSVSGLAARTPPGIINNKFELEEGDLDPSALRPGEIEADYYNYGAQAFNEIRLHNGEFLHNVGLRGQTMRIALLDAGFSGYSTLRAFDSMNANGQLLETWDFVAREVNVNDHSHGMQCLSTIIANIPGQFVGKAPEARVYLYRTEDAPTEYPIEELNLSCGAERADSAGAEVISISLGYTTFQDASLNHTYADMNGSTTMAAIATDLAAKKGILVFAAVGNDGGNSWNFLSTPSDGDSVIAVGAVTATGIVGGFSSFGPSSDGQIKPDVASVGVSAVIQGTGNTVVTGNGTSFACPNMAGLGTCLWQGFPEYNNMQIRFALWASGSRALNPDNRIGYGIPNVKLAFAGLLVDFANVNASVNTCDVTITWNSKDVQAMKYEIERKAPGDLNFVKVGETIPQAGTALTNRNYQFINSVNGISNGLVSYRVRQIIDTASATFMAVYLDTADITVSGCISTGTGDPNADKEFVKIAPNPNPSNQAVLIVQTRNAVTEMPVRIFDMKGRLVQTLLLSKGPGKINFDLSLHRLARGTYIIRVYNKVKLIGKAALLRL